MSLESLKKNLESQKKIARSTNKQVQEVERYCDHVNAQMISLTSAWEDNADRNGILKTMAACVTTAAEIAYDYNTFSVNAVNYLNNIENLEALAKFMIPGKAIKKKPFDVPPAKRKNRISVHPSILLDVAANLESYSSKLDAIKVETGSINAKIDSIIINKIAPKYSLKSIQKRIDVLSNMNQNAAKNLRTIAEKYKSVEKQLETVAADLANGAQSSNAVSSEIKKIYFDSRSALAYNMPEVKKYMVADFNDPSLYEHQIPGDSKCYKVSTVNLLRRKAVINGNDNWQNINQESYSNQITVDGVSVKESVYYNDDTGKYNVFTIANDDANAVFGEGPYPPAGKGFKSLSNDEKVTRLLSLLDNHPEGVVIHSTILPTCGQHAILITDYEVKADGQLQFYCSDPARQGGARIRIEDSLYYSSGDSVSDMIGRAQNYKACFKVG